MSFEKYGKNYFDYRTLAQIDSLYAWKHDLYFPPTVVEISPTSLCNQKCRYCYVAGRTIGRLDDKILSNIIPQLADAGVKAVVFQGTGEPLLHTALCNAIEIASQRKLSMSLTTNGVLLNESMQEKILPYLSYIKFSSLDNDPSRYAVKHGCSANQWDILIKNIENAVIKREKLGLNILYLATVYLSKENFHEAYNIVKFCKELGIDYVSIQEAVYSEFSYAGVREMTSTFFNADEINTMKEKVLTLKDDDLFIRVRFPLYDGTFINGRYKDTWINGWCQGIKFNTLISSVGEVYPCDRYWGVREFSYGNIYEKSFEEIWKGDRRKKIIEYTNSNPPQGDECNTCNVTKINDILWNLKQENKWRDFLV